MWPLILMTITHEEPHHILGRHSTTDGVDTPHSSVNGWVLSWKWSVPIKSVKQGYDSDHSPQAAQRTYGENV